LQKDANRLLESCIDVRYQVGNGLCLDGKHFTRRCN